MSVVLRRSPKLLKRLLSAQSMDSTPTKTSTKEAKRKMLFEGDSSSNDQGSKQRKTELINLAYEAVSSDSSLKNVVNVSAFQCSSTGEDLLLNTPKTIAIFCHEPDRYMSGIKLLQEICRKLIDSKIMFCPRILSEEYECYKNAAN